MFTASEQFNNALRDIHVSKRFQLETDIRILLKKKDELEQTKREIEKHLSVVDKEIGQLAEMDIDDVILR